MASFSFSFFLSFPLSLSLSFSLFLFVGFICFYMKIAARIVPLSCRLFKEERTGQNINAAEGGIAEQRSSDPLLLCNFLGKRKAQTLLSQSRLGAYIKKKIVWS